MQIASDTKVSTLWKKTKQNKQSGSYQENNYASSESLQAAVVTKSDQLNSL